MGMRARGSEACCKNQLNMNMGSLAKQHLILTRASLPCASPVSPPPSDHALPTRRAALTSAAGIFLAITSALRSRPAPASAADELTSSSTTTGDLKWGTRSFIREKYFSPGLTAEEAAARIRHTAEGMRSLRDMLDRMAWRYLLYYIRLKSSYLDTDLKTAMAAVPPARRNDYVQAANQLVDDMSELDRYIRTPKVYESYLYYEKTLKSLDNVVTFLA